MRNLKRALSLLLSSAMVVGMMVMGGSAAGYQDVDDTYNKEAIEVLQAVGIMTGDENGNFNPEKGVTRNEMAVIMSNLMAYNVATYSGTSPFTDVPSWAEPYVAACWTNGITSGTSATTYGGDETVTTAQAALMIMKALGYFQYSSDFGNDWQLATVSQGNKIDLFVDVNSGVKEAMTRNDVAQLVLNGLESGTVEAETNGSITVGDITIVNNVKYNLITSGEKYAYAINPDLYTANDGTTSSGSIVELGEKLYLGDLAKKRDVDDFGRPSNVWSYNSNEVGTYADEATYTHNTKVTSKALYNEVGSIAASDYEWHVFYNGVETDYAGKQLVANKTENDTDFVAKALGGTARTGTGVLTEVYVNNVDKEVYVAIVDTFVGEVTKVEDDAVTIKQFDNGNSQHPDLDSKKFETTDSGLAVGDIVLYTVSGKEIMSLQKAESVTGTLTAYQAKDPGANDTNANKDSYAKLDDTKYNYAVQMAKNLEDNTDIYPMGLNNEYVFYLDTFGNLIAFKGVEVVDNYLYVENAVKSAAGVDAKVRFADGEEKVINVSKVKQSTAGATYETATDVGAYDTAANEVAIGGIYTYSEDNGLYRLTALEEISVDAGIDVREYADLVDQGGTAYDFTSGGASVGDEAYAIKQGHSRIYPVTVATVDGNSDPATWTEVAATSYAVDSTTIFVDLASGEVFTGYQNVPSYSAVNVKVAFGKNGVADVVFIYNQYEKSNSGVYFFVNGDSRETWEANDITYRKYEVYINGEKQDLVTKDLTLTKNSVYKQIQVNADGQLIDADLVYNNSIITGVMGNVTGAHKATSIANNTLVLAAADATQGGKSIFNWDDETVFVNINTKYDSTGAVVVDTVEPGAATDIDVVNGTTAVYVISVNDKTNVAPTAKLVYIVTQPDADNLATVSFAGTTSEFQVNGSSPASISVVKGNNVTFTITGAVGYKVTGVSVNGTALTPDANTTNQYTLKNVNSNTTVTVATAADNSAKLDIAAPGQAATISVNGKIYANAAEIEGFENGEAVLVTIKFGASVPTNGQIVMYGDDVITAFSGDDYLINVDSSKQLKVGVATHTLNLPANVTATYTFKTVNGTANASTGTEIPEGATVTMTVGSSATYYVNYGTEYKKANDSFTAFEMTAPVTVAPDKYYLITMNGTSVDVNGQDLKSGTLTAALEGDTGTGVFVKDGESVNVTFVLADMTAGADAAIKAQLVNASDVTSTNFPNGSAAEIIASGAQVLTTDTDTITVSSASAADISIQYQLSA